jgi:hypothetical protein
MAGSMPVAHFVPFVKGACPMPEIANRKGIILSANDDGTYEVEDNDLNIAIFTDVVSATHWWSFLVGQE